jgi:hypothetical protein
MFSLHSVWFWSLNIVSQTSISLLVFWRQILLCMIAWKIVQKRSMLGAGRAFNIGATSTWVPTSISGMSFYLWKDTCCSHLSWHLQSSSIPSNTFVYKFELLEGTEVLLSSRSRVPCRWLTCHIIIFWLCRLGILFSYQQQCSQQKLWLMGKT